MRRSGLTRTSVYSQKLPNSYNSTDITDDQSIKTLPPSFDIMKKGKPFSLERPAFKMGTTSAIVDESKRTANLKNKRTGLGNNLIIRQSFETPSVLGRQATNFVLQELLDQQQQGVKVQLGDKTLNALFKLVTVDPEDKEWIAIYNTELTRLMGEGKSKEEAEEILKASPPLGRPQRPTTKMVNFASLVDITKPTSALSITEKLDALTVSLKSLVDLDLPKTLATLMSMITGIGSFTPEQCAKISALLDATKEIPADYTGYGFTHAIFSLDQYNAEIHNVNTFLGANIPLGLLPHRPVYSSGGSPIEWKQIPKTLREIHNAVDQNGNAIPTPNYEFYLYLPYRRIISRADALELVNNSGVDSGQLNGVDPPDGLSGESPHWLSNTEEATALTKKKTLESTEPDDDDETEIDPTSTPPPSSPLGGDPLDLGIDDPFMPPPPPRPPKEPIPGPPPTPTKSWEVGARIEPLDPWDFGAGILPMSSSDKFYPDAHAFYYARVSSAYARKFGVKLNVAKENVNKFWANIKKDKFEKQRWENARTGTDPDEGAEINRYYYLKNITAFGDQFPAGTPFEVKSNALTDQWKSLDKKEQDRWVRASFGVSSGSSSSKA